METRELLVRMLRQLLQDTHALHQQGAGYFSCTPIAKRYNKLLDKARASSAGAAGIMDTFDPIGEDDPKDPAEKMKIVQGIRIEINQLVSVLDSLAEDAQ
ncbi:MAG: hypothetical protein GY851_12210 [bacterium]|nr:hypothetical protein [bacterium]